MTEPVIVLNACALIAYFNDEEGAGAEVRQMEIRAQPAVHLSVVVEVEIVTGLSAPSSATAPPPDAGKPILWPLPRQLQSLENNRRAQQRATFHQARQFGLQQINIT